MTRCNSLWHDAAMTTDPTHLRLLHTSDWHLGQDLHDLPRDVEHQAFLDWLLETMGAQDVDALLVTGDVFDSQNPPVSAQRRLYDFLAKAKMRRPRLNIVIIGGNHDSAARLEAPTPFSSPWTCVSLAAFRATRQTPW